MCRDCNGKYKFSFMEMITSGKDGSTSATGFIGVILSLVCILMAVRPRLGRQGHRLRRGARSARKFENKARGRLRRREHTSLR